MDQGTWLAFLLVFFLKKCYKKLTSMPGLAPPQRYRREVRELDKREGVKKMPERVAPMCLDWSLLKILCVMFRYLPATPHSVLQPSKSLHHSSFTPPATLLLYFPCGAWDEIVNLWSFAAKEVMIEKVEVVLPCTARSALPLFLRVCRQRLSVVHQGPWWKRLIVVTKQLLYDECLQNYQEKSILIT